MRGGPSQCLYPPSHSPHFLLLPFHRPPSPPPPPSLLLPLPPFSHPQPAVGARTSTHTRGNRADTPLHTHTYIYTDTCIQHYRYDSTDNSRQLCPSCPQYPQRWPDDAISLARASCPCPHSCIRIVLFLDLLLLQPETVTFPAHSLNRCVCAYRSSATVLAHSPDPIVLADLLHNLYNTLAPDCVRRSQLLRKVCNTRGADCACTSLISRRRR
jgi:hypothetical protein